MHICTECGRVSDRDLDFCEFCGSKKGANVDPALIPPEFGIAETPRGRIIVREDLRKLRLSLILALFPGIFNVFGLGHLLTKRYLKGIPLLGISVLYYAERITGYFGVPELLLIGLSIACFAYQAFDQMTYVKKKLSR